MLRTGTERGATPFPFHTNTQLNSHEIHLHLMSNDKRQKVLFDTQFVLFPSCPLEQPHLLSVI